MTAMHHSRVPLLVAAAAFLAGPALAAAQGWKSPTGSAYAVSVSGANATTAATVELPDGGGASRAEQASVSTSSLTATNATAVTSGTQSADLLGVQSVATASDVSILGGRITASRVFAIATARSTGNQSAADADGSGATGLVIDGVSYADDAVAPNTRVELPGVGYVVLNEQVSARGRVTGLTVNMIHVVLVDQAGKKTGDIVVASATSADSK